MLSANAIDPHHMLDAERLYDDTLMKPIDLRQLLKKIHALVDIEWIYETHSRRRAIRQRPLRRPQSALPNSGDLDELIPARRDRSRDRGFSAKLDEIDASAPECLAFTNECVCS